MPDNLETPGRGLSSVSQLACRRWGPEHQKLQGVDISFRKIGGKHAES